MTLTYLFSITYGDSVGTVSDSRPGCSDPPPALPYYILLYIYIIYIIILNIDKRKKKKAKKQAKNKQKQVEDKDRPMVYSLYDRATYSF